HVHLSDLHLALIGCGDFIDNRGERLTRATPRSPEINHDRLIALKHHLIEVAVCYFQNAIACHETFPTSFFQIDHRLRLASYPSKQLDVQSAPKFQAPPNPLFSGEM